MTAQEVGVRVGDIEGALLGVDGSERRPPSPFDRPDAPRDRRPLGVPPRAGTVGHQTAEAVTVASDKGISGLSGPLGMEHRHSPSERARCRQPFKHVQRGRASRKHAPVGKNKPKQ